VCLAYLFESHIDRRFIRGELMEVPVALDQAVPTAPTRHQLGHTHQARRPPCKREPPK
jgi:hypothetical protein